MGLNAKQIIISIKSNKNLIKEFLKYCFILVFPLFLFFMLQIDFIFKNYAELDICIKSILSNIAVNFFISIVFILIIQLLLCIYNKKFINLLTNICFFIGLFFYFEYYFVTPAMGVFKGQDFILSNFISLVIIELVTFISALYFFIKFIKTNKNWLHIESLTCIVLSIIIFAGLLTSKSSFLAVKELLHNDNKLITHKYYDIEFSKYTEYSKNKNIVIVLLDTYSSNIFNETIRKYPELSNIVKDFEWYTNFHSTLAKIGTKNIVPIIFGGEYIYPDCKNEGFNEDYYKYLKKIYTSDNSFLSKLKADGYRTEVYPISKSFHYLDETQLDNLKVKNIKFGSDISLFEKKLLTNLPAYFFLPIAFKKSAYNFLTYYSLHKDIVTRGLTAIEDASADTPIGTDNLSFYDEYHDNGISVNPNLKKVFKYIHIDGVHEPFNLNKDLTIIEDSKKYSLESTSYANLKIMEEYFNTLKKAGIYDNTAIIIMGDHGIRKCIDGAKEFCDTEKYTNPLLLYKDINQKQQRLKVIKDVVPDTKDISHLVLYSAKLTKNKFNITAKEKLKRLQDFK